MASSTIKNNGKQSISLNITPASNVTIMTKTFRFNNSGVAELNVQFHITTEAPNGSTLFTITNGKNPDHSVFASIISAANRANYGNVNLSSGGVVTAGGVLPASDWYSLHVVYFF